MPSPRLKSKRATRPRPLSDAEAARNVVLHLRHGFGYEFLWPGDDAYVQHHRELTLPALRRLWPEHREELMAARRDPGTRPFGWWLADAPEAARRAYLAAWRARGADVEADETQARLLDEAGLLTDEERAELAPTLGGDTR